MVRFVLVTLIAALPANLSWIREFYISAVLRAAKIRFCTTPPGDFKWCVLCYLRWEQPNLQILAQYGDFRFWLIWGHQKSALSQIVPETSNGAFCVIYIKTSVTCKFEIYGDFRFWLIWDQQKSDFSQLVSETSNGAFCVSYAEDSLTCKFELNPAILDFGRFEVWKNLSFYNSSRRPQIVRFVLDILRAA